MSERSVNHATFTTERSYEASPARVFNAWADPDAKARWFGDPEGTSESEFDFRVGGYERSRGSMGDDGTFAFDARYHDIVADERIVYTYDLRINDVLLSVSLASVELSPAGTGTRLVYTESGAFLDGHDDPKLRERGTIEILDALGRELERQASPA